MKSVTRTLTPAGLVLLLVASPASANPVGPFHGAIHQGQTRTHTYDNNPNNHACIQIVDLYTVALAYTPPTDTLTLSVRSGADTFTATGVAGTALVAFQANHCTSFDISVTGTSVADNAQYDVTVVRVGDIIVIPL